MDIMTGKTLTSDGLDARQRRILYRSWHRGTREVDLLLGPFVEAEIGAMEPAEIDVLEHLMDASDQDLYAWFTGAKPVPDAYDTPLFRQIRDFLAARAKS